MKKAAALVRHAYFMIKFHLRFRCPFSFGGEIVFWRFGSFNSSKDGGVRWTEIGMLRVGLEWHARELWLWLITLTTDKEIHFFCTNSCTYTTIYLLKWLFLQNDSNLEVDGSIECFWKYDFICSLSLRRLKYQSIYNFFYKVSRKNVFKIAAFVIIILEYQRRRI